MVNLSSFLTNAQRETVHSQAAKPVARRFREDVEHAYSCHFRIPPDQQEAFDDAIDGEMWLNGYVAHPHAAAAELREYHNFKVRKRAQGQSVIAFGGKPEADLCVRKGRRPNPCNCVHICSKHTSRDTARYFNSASFLRKFHSDKPVLLELARTLEDVAGGKPRSKAPDIMCFNGGEECRMRFPEARIAIALDSTYDVTPSQFITFMRRKGLTTAYVSMLMPDNLFWESDSYNKIFKWRYVRRHGKLFVEQTFVGSKANGTAYEHDHENWCNWFLTSTIATNEGTYQFSIIDETGPYKVIEIMLQKVPVPRKDTQTFDFNGMVAVPRADALAKVALAARGDHCTEKIRDLTDRVTWIMIPKNIYTTFANWASTLDKADWYAGLNHWRGLTKGLVFGGHRVMERYDAGYADKVFASVWASVMTMRWRASETMSILTEDMRKRQELGLFIEYKDSKRIRPRARYRPGGNSWFQWRWDVLKHSFSHFVHTLGLPFYDLEADVARMCLNEMGALASRTVEEVDMPLQHLLLDTTNITLADPRPTVNTGIGSTVSSKAASEIELCGRFQAFVDQLEDQAAMAPEQLRMLISECAELGRDYNLTFEGPPATLLIGPAGCGKTSHMLERAKGKVLFIAASRALAAEVEDRVKMAPPSSTASKDWHVRTQHKALMALRSGEYDTVILDEVYTYHAGYVLWVESLRGKANLWLLGDPNQCLYYDEEMRTEIGGFAEIANNYKVHALEKMHRSPQAVIKFLQNIKNFNCTGTSKIKGNFELLSEKSIKTIAKKPVDAFITISRDRKESLQEAVGGRATVYTAREAQGRTFRDVLILLDEPPTTSATRRMYYVAVTRATNRVITVINKDSGKVDINLERAQLELAMSAFYEFVPYTNSSLEEPKMAVHVLRTEYNDEPEHWTDAVVTGALDTALGEAPDMNHTALAVVPNDIIWQADKFFRISGDRVVPVDVNFSGYVYGGKKWTKAMWAKSKLQVLETLTARQGNDVGKPPVEVQTEIDDTVRRIADAFERRYIKHEGSRPRWAPLDDSNLTQHVANYLERCQEVGNIDLIENFDLTNPKHTGVTTEMKRITKIVAGGPSSPKAGQAISAWHKSLTALIAPLTRTIERCLIDSLNEHTHFANAITEGRLGELYAMACAETGGLDEAAEGLNMDFSQFDASQSKVTIAIEREILRRMGASSDLLDAYYQMRSEWTSVCHGIATIDAQSLKSSGEPGTLLFNTILNMAYCAFITDVRNVRFQAFKGDDSCIVSDNTTIKQLELELLKAITRVTIKRERGKHEVNHFCGGFYTPKGYVPDYVRMAAKIRGMVFRDEEHFKEYQQAINDRIKTGTGVTVGYRLVVHDSYYNVSKLLETSAVAEVVAFVNWFSKAEWAEFIRHCTKSDSRNGGASIIVANCKSQCMFLPPYNAEHIREAYWEATNELPPCPDCYVNSRELALPCKGVRRCLICKGGKNQSHLCVRCARTYEGDGISKCSKLQCDRPCVFRDTEDLCLHHFKMRYKHHRGKPSNTYSVSSKSSVSSRSYSTRKRDPWDRPIGRTTLVSRNGVTKPLAEALQDVQAETEADNDVETDCSSDQARRLVSSADTMLECGVDAVRAQLGDVTAVAVRGALKSKRRARVTKTKELESPYVREEDLHDVLNEMEIPWVQAERRPDTQVADITAAAPGLENLTWKKPEQPILLLEISPGQPDPKDKLEIQDSKRKLDKLETVVNTNVTRGKDVRLTFERLEQMRKEHERLRNRVNLSCRLRAHWEPRPTCRFVDTLSIVGQSWDPGSNNFLGRTGGPTSNT